MSENDRDTTSLFGEVIHSYTRAQAIADGVLFDISKLAREAGFKYPVACTSGVTALLEVPPGLKGCQDVTGRTWDVLTMLRFAIKQSGSNVDRLPFQVLFQMEPEQEPVLFDLMSYIGPGDKGEPVLTIMLPDED